MSGDFTHAADPFPLFHTWLEEAEASEPNDPNAMAVATVDSDGLPNLRMVLLTGHGPDGFVFYTNFEGTKGRELLAHRKAALLFHWNSRRRQVRIRGGVTEVTPAEADEYFQSRARGSRIGAWASAQSRPLASREELEQRVAELEARYPDFVPRPAYWSGFQLTPVEIEFWQDGMYRLHDRIVFRRPDAATPWTKTRLNP